MRPGHRILAPLLPLLAAVMLVACGGDSGSGGTVGTGASGSQQATLVLDFVPGPVHAGIYEALAKGYYEDEGIDLEIVEPTSTADTLKLIDAGKADFGIADGIDLATQIAAGRGAQGILAIAQRPLGGLITLTDSGIGSPAELEGRTVGVTGVPSDDAILDTIVAADGGDPAKVDTVTIGFNGVSNLENGNVDAITGFIPADGGPGRDRRISNHVLRARPLRGPGLSGPGRLLHRGPDRGRSGADAGVRRARPSAATRT